MNKLTYLDTINNGDDTTIYMLPVNPTKTLYLQETELYLHILNMQGDSVRVIPAFYNDDGVYFKLSQLNFLGSGTFAFYLELKYSQGSDNYPDNEVKYLTINYDNQGKLKLLNVFGANYSGYKDIKPPKNTMPSNPAKDEGGMTSLPFDDIKVTTVDSDEDARVVIDKKVGIIRFIIPRGKPGLRGLQGLQGEPGIPGVNGKDGTNGKDGVNGATWQPYINKTDGHWHIKRIAGDTGLDASDMQRLKDYIDNMIENGKW